MKPGYDDLLNFIIRLVEYADEVGAQEAWWYAEARLALSEAGVKNDPSATRC